MRSKFVSYVLITRPVNLAIALLSVCLGVFVAKTAAPLEKVVFACVSSVAIMAGGNTINDFFDVDIDRINKSFRPIPSGRMTQGAALQFSIILFVLGNFLSIFITIWAFGVALFTSFGLILYSAKLKHLVFAGNLGVSLFSALIFIYGGLAAQNWFPALIPAGFAFLFHLGREIIKDVEDQEADKAQSLRTLPVRYGEKTALVIITIVFVCLIFFTLVPYGAHIYGKEYLWTVLIGVDFVLLACLVYMWKNPLPYALRRISAVLKADMVIGLCAIVVGTVA
ncbi:MAG: geranylgeranylglycerol-phosphate geranylgeranyltransferase [bacterium]